MLLLYFNKTRKKEEFLETIINVVKNYQADLSKLTAGEKNFG